MRTTLSLALAAVLFTTAVEASDHHVPQSTLAAVGLSDLQVLSDAQGEQVRGMHGGVKAYGVSIVNGLLLDPVSNSFIFGSDANSAAASSAHGGFAASQQTSAIALSLAVEPSGVNPGFYSALIGGAGGSAYAKN